MPRPRILYVDADDSFSNNIVALLETELNAQVEIVKHRDDRFLNAKDGKFPKFLKYFDAVVAGPGPGVPTIPEDIGIIQQLWSLQGADILPVFGICLGFQSMCAAFGAKVKNLNAPRHGTVHHITTAEFDMMEDIPDFWATSYHSLYVSIGTVLGADTTHRQLWERGSLCPNIKPLAWDTSDTVNGSVLMAARHAGKPFWGVQFHPESICTDKEGQKVILQWWRAAQEWIECHRRKIDRGLVPENWKRSQEESSKMYSLLEGIVRAKSLLKNREIDVSGVVHWGVAIIKDNRLDVDRLCRLLRVPEHEGIVFRSGMDKHGCPLNEQLGRFTIISPSPALHLQYDTHSHHVSVYTLEQRNKALNRVQALPTALPIDDIWAYLKGFMEPLQCKGGCPSVPFWGGLMGYVSYEAGLERISVQPQSSMQTTAKANSDRPDILFALVTRSVVIDHCLNKIYIQSLQTDDDDWIKETAAVVVNFIVESNKKGTWRGPVNLEEPVGNEDAAAARKRPGTSSETQAYNGIIGEEISNPREWEPKLPLAKPWKRYPNLMPAGCDDPESRIRNQWCAYLVDLVSPKAPDYIEYATKILECEAAIRYGSSYELCLTNQIKLLTASSGCSASSGWLLFESLGLTNPAPFSAFIRLCSRLDAVTVVSSSPERFLSWNRSGKCEFRPIKGTVKRGPGISAHDAAVILNSSKERAENLMITDLIRHDLHGVAGAGNVKVSKLMQIEEYATVYQLVSAIEGQLGRASNDTLEDMKRSQLAKTAHVPRRQSTGSILDRPAHLVGQKRPNFLPNGNRIHRSSSQSILHIAKPKSDNFAAQPIATIIAKDKPKLYLPTFADMKRHDLERKYKQEAAAKKKQDRRKVNGHAAESKRNVPGIDVLAASLPPGSMTGAPKKRSCELLQEIERGEPRGIYSGVLGYLDVGGGGDFSVVIRTAYRWDSDVRHVQEAKSSNDPNDSIVEEWTIGAGGAITVQSNVDGEYNEMLTKLNSTLGAFSSNLTKKAPEPWTENNHHGYIALMELISDLNEGFPGRVQKKQGLAQVSTLELMTELHNRFPEYISGHLIEVAAAAAYQEHD